MTEQHPSQEPTVATIASVRSGSSLPVAYRLVTKDDGNGNSTPVLQGYYSWIDYPSGERGSEWRDLETQDWLDADDKIPHSSLQ
jgi:hypothetical protein